MVLDIRKDLGRGEVTIKPSLIERLVYRELSLAIQCDESASGRTTLTGAEGIRTLLAMLQGVDVATST